jgi:hypothetical protein
MLPSPSSSQGVHHLITQQNKELGLNSGIRGPPSISLDGDISGF